MYFMTNNEKELSLCLLCRFKNERHIMYEFINHYLNEGVDCIILIDNESDDDYLTYNHDWLNELIQSHKVIIVNSSSAQIESYNNCIKHVKKFDWLLVCDMDEFMFAVSSESTIKSLLNTQLNTYQYIKIPWKLFTHDETYQPKSVIYSNTYTHSVGIDPTSSSKGYKYIVRTNYIKHLNIHRCECKEPIKKLNVDNCHNNIIQSNHYRTQSEEYLRGVKETRGGGVHKRKYLNYEKHNLNIYNKQCLLLKNKREKLIHNCFNKIQVKPAIDIRSSFYLEQSQLEAEKDKNAPAKKGGNKD